MNEKLLDKLAELAVKIGANVQKGQYLFINSSTENKDLARLIVKHAYLVGAKNVEVNWRDEYADKYKYLYQSVEDLSNYADWKVQKYQDFVDKGGCVISITSPIPGLNDDLDPAKVKAASRAANIALSFYYDKMMASKLQWSIVAAPNEIWAKKVFPDLDEATAVSKLWDEVFKASRVTEDNDPIAEWKNHNKRMSEHNEILNNYNFEKLFFKNSLGTDIEVKLVENHIWVGGGELSPEGVLFNPNIPTEEAFTCPHKYGVNGKVVATKPLTYEGKLIEDFWIEFKDGKVVDFDARTNRDALETLINFDEGSSYLGEIALISDDSPISNSGVLFYNTLFDENASCHMALGRAYVINIKDGANTSREDLDKKGVNYSMAHSDFMFGSKDLSVIGVTKNGKEIIVFKDGNFII
jgi:aminopeptidase